MQECRKGLQEIVAMMIGVSVFNNRKKRIPWDELIEIILKKAIRERKIIYTDWIHRAMERKTIYKHLDFDNLNSRELRK